MAKEISRNIVANLEKYPAIWDVSDKDYHNTVIKDRQFAELAELCETDVDVTKTKYASLRTQFRKVTCFNDLIKRLLAYNLLFSTSTYPIYFAGVEFITAEKIRSWC